ncbi:MAG: hypothetical protein HY319_32145 [Armatimonadetes bacterium]|nr:hypothetical protein [Armatimonadota bacterium]
MGKSRFPEEGFGPLELPGELGPHRYELTNVRRHSGARRVEVSLRLRGGHIEGRVQDDGKGFDPESLLAASPQKCIGLRGMVDRAELLGGKFRILSGSGRGTTVEFQLPVKPGAARGAVF